MKKRKRSITEVVADTVGFPDTLSASTPDVYIIGTREISVDGCRGILVYETTEVALRLKDRVMTVKGEELTLKTFFASHVTVRGRISAISSEEGL